MGLDNIAALEARTQFLEDAVKEMKDDIKAILGAVQDLKLTLATAPSRESFELLEQRVRSLEDELNKARGGWKAMVTIGSLVGAVIGWVFSYFSK
ncbi:MAG TPA: hypothetical protein VEH04_16825 [Verrucomicrobiae bacterium]|nr:hypothetical protein [Verrucomicrobiae bacterium]